MRDKVIVTENVLVFLACIVFKKFITKQTK